MIIKNAIKEIINTNNKSQSWLSEKMGYANPSGIGQMLQRGQITLSTLLRICEVFDYELTIQPKRTAGVRPKGQIIIDSGEEK